MIMFLIDTPISLRLLIHFATVCYDSSGTSTLFNVNYLLLLSLCLSFQEPSEEHNRAVTRVSVSVLDLV